jgi:hypothetical protein
VVELLVALAAAEAVVDIQIQAIQAVVQQLAKAIQAVIMFILALTHVVAAVAQVDLEAAAILVVDLDLVDLDCHLILLAVLYTTVVAVEQPNTMLLAQLEAVLVAVVMVFMRELVEQDLLIPVEVVAQVVVTVLAAAEEVAAAAL